MKISGNFNRLYHKVIREFKDLEVATIDFMGEDFKMRTTLLSYNSVKQLLKQLDENYPKNKDGIGISTIDITSKELTQHLEWIINVIYQNGGKVDIIEEEFKRIKE